MGMSINSKIYVGKLPSTSDNVGGSLQSFNNNQKNKKPSKGRQRGQLV